MSLIPTQQDIIDVIKYYTNADRISDYEMHVNNFYLELMRIGYKREAVTIALEKIKADEFHRLGIDDKDTVFVQ